MKNREIECIQRLIDKGLFHELEEFILENKFATVGDFKELTRDAERSLFICKTFHEAAAEEKLILLDYEWSLLPLETIKVTCVTQTEKREFTHGY